MGSLLAGVLGLTLGGWMADRIGSKRATVFMFVVWAVFLVGLFSLRAAWGDPQLVTVVIVGWVSLDTLITVVALPIAMRLSDPRVAATQFTIYMAISNFGITLGALFLGQADAMGGIPNLLLTAGGISLVAAIFMGLVAWPRRQVAVEVAEELPMADGMVPMRD